MTNPTDKAEMFARRIVSLVFEGGTKGDFDADVVGVTIVLREFAASLQPGAIADALAGPEPPRGERGGGFLRSVENALRHGIPPEGTGERKMTNDKNENTLRLTNGNGTFLVSQIVSDNLGPLHAKDSRGAGYSRCQAPCNHEFAPADATVWHDDENTEELWEVK